MATTEQFSLRWNNFHSNISSSFNELLQANDMVDVTLSAEGQFLQAHKLVLSICSPFFKQIFKVNPCKHPVIVLRDVSYGNLKDILNFMYLGEVNVLRDNLSAFLRTAELLQVKGLTGDDSSETSKHEDSLCEDDHENDLQTLIEPKLPLMPIPLTMAAPTVPAVPICNMKRNKKVSTNSKRTKSEKIMKSIDEDLECMESTDPRELKIENAYDDNSSTNNNEIIKQLLENNLSAAQDTSITQEDGMLFSMDRKGHVYCPYCYRKFVNRYNLKVHIRDKHDNSPINLDCFICGKTMRNRSCLRVHLYHHRKQQIQLEHMNIVESNVV